MLYFLHFYLFCELVLIEYLIEVLPYLPNGVPHASFLSPSCTLEPSSGLA